MRRATKGCTLLSAILAILGIGLFVLVLLAADGRIFEQAQFLVLRLQLRNRSTDLDAPFGSDPAPIHFHIPPGTSAGAIAVALADAGLIGDAGLFVDYARVESYDRRFEAGLYFLNQRQSIRQIAEILTDSSKSFILFRTLEGARIEELAELIDQNRLFGFSSADFLPLVDQGASIPADFSAWAGVPPGASLEGFMFPDTYQLPPAIDAAGLARYPSARLSEPRRRRAARRSAKARADASSDCDPGVDHRAGSGLARRALDDRQRLSQPP